MTPWKKEQNTDPQTKDYVNVILKKKRKKKRPSQSGGQGASNEELCDIWKKNYCLICLLQDKNISNQQRKLILQTLTKGQVKGLCCLIHDTIYSQRNLKLTAEEAKKMQRDKELIKALANKRVSVDNKKKILESTKGGNLLSLFLPLASLVAEPLIGQISKLFHKRR